MRKKDIPELRAKAAEYRALARQTADDESAHEIFSLAAELEQQARDIEQNK
jgi:F420-dependent methylenetetrahydromethanopterin dehydrogenase